MPTLGWLRGQFVAVGDKLPHHYFGVDEILWATQTYKTDFQAGINSRRDVQRVHCNLQDSR